MDNIRYKPLPTTLFMVRVPIIATYNEYEITTFGLPIDTINGSPNMSTYHELTTVMLPLDKIIDIYVAGHPIRLVNSSDLSTIYTMLDEYVRGVSNPGEYHLNVAGIVEDRLFDIERFAAEVFDTHKVAILKQTIQIVRGFGKDLNLMGHRHKRETPKDIDMTISTHMSGYSTILTPTRLEEKINTTNSVKDRLRANPDKKDLSTGYTYINNNLPEINLENAIRIKNVVKLK